MQGKDLLIHASNYHVHTEHTYAPLLCYFCSPEHITYSANPFQSVVR